MIGICVANLSNFLWKATEHPSNSNRFQMRLGTHKKESSVGKPLEKKRDFFSFTKRHLKTGKRKKDAVYGIRNKSFKLSKYMSLNFKFSKQNKTIIFDRLTVQNKMFRTSIENKM